MLGLSSSSPSLSPSRSAAAAAERTQTRYRVSPTPVAADDDEVEARGAHDASAADSEREAEGADSPQSAPRMSISLFLDSSMSNVPSSAPRSRLSAVRSPPHSMQPSASQPFPASPSSSLASSSTEIAAAGSTEPTELYFQSGDVIFVVPPPPFATRTAVTPSASARSRASTERLIDAAAELSQSASSATRSLSSSPSRSFPSSHSPRGLLLPPPTVLYPSVHLVHVYVLPSLSCISTLRGHDSCVEQVYRDDWCDASDQVITQTALGSVYVWSLSTGELVQRMEAKSEWLSAFLMTRRLFPLPAITQVSALVLDDSQMPAVSTQSMDDEDDAMLSGVSSAVCVYENQRFYPLLGWSSKLLPTERPPLSNASGTREFSKKQFKLLPRWRWTSGWEVVRDDTTDVDGWSYAMDFSRTARGGDYRGFHRKTFIHSVRRRKWVRRRRSTHEPTAQALASATLDDYIEHKQSTPLLALPADSPLHSATRSLSHTPPKLVTQLSDKPPRSTPLLSPTPIKTRRRKAKTERGDHLTADETRALTRPTSRSTASDQEPPSVHLSLSQTPSPHSAHVLPLSSSVHATTPSSASTSPSLPSPKEPRRQVSATSRGNRAVSHASGSGSGSRRSSPPVSPSTLSSVLSRVKVEMQPSDELKQTIKRMLLSHNRPTTVPGKPATPAHIINSGTNAAVSATAEPSTRRKLPRRRERVARTSGQDTPSDEQKERPSGASQQLPAPATTAIGQHSKHMESKEAELGTMNGQQTPRVREFKLGRQRMPREADGAETAHSKEPLRRKKPISYNTLPSPPRSSSIYSLALPFDASVPSLPPSPPLSPGSPASQSLAIRVEVWENQRNYPVLGWSARLLPTDPYPPYSDSAGHLWTFEMCELLLSLDMDWLTDWTARRSADTDADGWQYAVDWSWEWSSKQRVLTTVRRRCWTREKAVRRVGPNVVDDSHANGRSTAKQLSTSPTAIVHSVGDKRRGGGSGSSNHAVSHSRSQSLYVPAGLPQSSSAHSLSSLASSAPLLPLSSSLTASLPPRRASLPDTATEIEHATAQAFYDPSAGEPEEL